MPLTKEDKAAIRGQSDLARAMEAYVQLSPEIVDTLLDALEAKDKALREIESLAHRMREYVPCDVCRHAVAIDREDLQTICRRAAAAGGG